MGAPMDVGGRDANPSASIIQLFSGMPAHPFLSSVKICSLDPVFAWAPWKLIEPLQHVLLGFGLGMGSSEVPLTL